MKEDAKRDSFAIGFIKYILPVVVVFAAIGVTVGLVVSKAKPAEKTIEKIVPKVNWVQVTSGDKTLVVSTQGVVKPRVSTQLISEVSGIVEWVSPSLYAGGFFKKGDVLLKIEPTDYEVAVANARSVLAQMELLYQQEVALSEQALKDWQDMGEGEATDLVLRKPQLAKTEADLEFAKVSLKRAERNLSYTVVRAPYDGRVKEKFVDLGQSVASKASQLASIYSVDTAEIRLSVSQQNAAFLQLPEGLGETTANTAQKPKVIVFAGDSDDTDQWQGYIDRTEGTIDTATRLVYAIAKVENPYGIGVESPRAPLKVGMFVKVDIEGRTVPDAVEIPRGALNPGDIVYVLNDENRLQIRKVEVIKRGIDTIIVGAGLNESERIVTTPLRAVSEGMLLDPIAIEPSGNASGEDA